MIYTFEHVAHFADKEHDLKELYGMIESAGMAPALFYDGYVTNAKIFCETVIANEWWLIRTLDESGRIVCIWWLNAKVGRAEMIHLCSLVSLEDTIKIGKQAMKFLADLGHWDCIYGLTPKVYRHIFPVLKGIGFKVQPDALPGSCFMERKGKYVAGAISVFDLREL